MTETIYQTFALEEDDSGWWTATQRGVEITGRGASAAEAIRNYCDVVLGDDMARQDVREADGDGGGDGCDWSAVGFVSGSEYRQRVLESLRETERTPTELSEDTGIKTPHISRTLSELRERDLVELLVDEETQKGRYHGITPGGREALKEVLQRA